MNKYLVTDQDAHNMMIVDAGDPKEAATYVNFDDYFLYVYCLGPKATFEKILVERTYDE